jgi:hypothetical protein
VLVEISEAEAREVCLILRHVYDAGVTITDCTPDALQIYISVATKLQDALKISDTPWENPDLYESREG